MGTKEEFVERCNAAAQKYVRHGDLIILLPSVTCLSLGAAALLGALVTQNILLGVVACLLLVITALMMRRTFRLATREDDPFHQKVNAFKLERMRPIGTAPAWVLSRSEDFPKSKTYIENLNLSEAEKDCVYGLADEFEGTLQELVAVARLLVVS